MRADAISQAPSEETSKALQLLRSAAGRSEVLIETADQLLRDAVDRCIQSGCTWDQVGQALRISRQAAQQRFHARASRPAETESDPDAMIDQLEYLVTGLTQRLTSAPRSTGGRAGVFTIWYRGQLVYLGHARLSAQEARESNSAQADGARGRIGGLRRQPTKSLQAAMIRHFPADVDQATGSTPQKKVSAALIDRGEFRLAEAENGAEASRLYAAAKDWLPGRGYRILADER